MKSKLRRAGWFAGTRSEILHLGLRFKALKAAANQHDLIHEFIFTGEQGVGACQSLDLLNLTPDEEYELRFPAEDPALRLNGLLKRVEEYARQHRLTHIIFSGFGPTAGGAALVCLSREIPGLWLRPADPIGLNARQNFEGGIERMIQSVRNIRVEQLPSIQHSDSTQSVVSERPVCIIHIGRYIWGIKGVLGKLAHIAAEWARKFPDVDFLVLDSMNARLEGPFASMENPPANLLFSSPLPLPEFAARMGSANVVLTDSPNLSAECIERRIPLIALGELASNDPEEMRGVLQIVPEDLATDRVAEFLRESFSEKPKAERATPHDDKPMLEAIESFLSA